MSTLSDKQQKFIDHFASQCGLNVKRTCEVIGIHRSTYYEWLGDADTPNAFRSAVNDCAEGLKDDIETAMYSKMIEEGNVPLMIHFSKTKMRERGWCDHQTIDQGPPRLEIAGDVLYKKKSGVKYIESTYVEPKVSVYLPDNDRDKPDTPDTIG